MFHKNRLTFENNPLLYTTNEGDTMLTIPQILTTHHGRLCRQCLNDYYHLHLSPSDCVYDGPYQRQCVRCGQVRNNMGGLRWSGRMKTLFK